MKRMIGPPKRDSRRLRVLGRRRNSRASEIPSGRRDERAELVPTRMEVQDV